MNDEEKTRGSNLPDPKEIEKEINEFLANKYGNRIRVMGTQIGPWPGVDETSGGEPIKQDTEPSHIRFDMKPAELHDYLDRFVIRQDLAKEMLSTKICTHFNRIRYFQQILDGFLRSVNERKGVVSARVTAAEPLSPQELKSLEDKLAGITGKTVNVELETDAGLLGGIVVQMGSTVYDGSIRTKLADLKRRLAET